MPVDATALVRHAPAAFAATAVLVGALMLAETQPPPVKANCPSSYGPVPEAETAGLLDVCARRIGCLKR